MIFFLKLKDGRKGVSGYIWREPCHEVQELRSRALVGTGRTPRAGKTG
jgi:hypothetical protein